jgi:hypothetical protein
MRTELVTHALQMALVKRRPDPGLIWHLRPGQPVRLARLRSAGPRRRDRAIDGSRGDCYDNAVAESFFATLKTELIHGRSWPSNAELRTEVFEYIEVFFNRRRRHSALGFLPPEQFETITNHHHLKERQPRLTTPCPPTRGNSTNPRPLSGARTEASRLPIRRAQRVRRTTALDAPHSRAVNNSTQPYGFVQPIYRSSVFPPNHFPRRQGRIKRCLSTAT